MAEPQLTFLSLVMLLSLIAYLVCGVVILRAKEFGEKKRKNLGTVLLVASVLNFILFNVLAFKRYTYSPVEFAALILFFLIPFAEGMVFLVSKEINLKLKKPLGILLILLMFLFLIITATVL
jgi:peptidoglycan/LPS O-acetylase OafA/YrhL